MTLQEFEALHLKFTKFPISKEELDTPEYESYIEELDSNEEFYNWTLKWKFESLNFQYKNFCCLEMADKIFESLDEKGEIKYDDVDVVINKWNDGTYGIPIHDGGTSIIKINYCPWCGKSLKMPAANNRL